MTLQAASWLLTSVYYTVCLLLTLFGLYRLAILYSYLRASRCSKPAPPAPPAIWPSVTVQLPLFNERYVARRLLEAVSRLDYPLDKLHIQILDDSTDRTVVLTRRLATRLAKRGLQVEHLHRTHRTGFKAGALAAGLARSKSELVAIFDADFVPPRDFLRRIVPHALLPQVGAVQARWEHLNREASWFTRLQAILLDGHFAIEQPVRYQRGCFLSFNGTCGVWRRQAIEAAGGWSSDTLTEDLDLSMRAQLAGWRVVYLADLVVPGELPLDSNSFRSQQRRWTKGGVQVARKLLPRILSAPLPARVKIEATLHLTCYSAYPLLILLVVLRTPARLLTPQTSWLGLLPGELQLLVLSTLPLVLFYTLAQRAANPDGSIRRFLWRSIPAMALGAGLAVSNTRAVLGGLLGRDLRFERTPKLGDSPIGRRTKTYRAPGTRPALLEVFLLVYLFLWKTFGTGWTVFNDVPFLLFFGFGLFAMAMPSLFESRKRRVLDPPVWRRPLLAVGRVS